jgi:hypothetical protein
LIERLELRRNLKMKHNIVLIKIIATALLLLAALPGSVFGSEGFWTSGAYYGTRGTFFADVTGNGSADTIFVGS